MSIKLILIFCFSFLYGLFEVYMNIRQQRNSNVKNSGDKGSLWILYLLIGVGYYLSFLIGSTKLGRIYHWDLLFTIGSILVLTGLFIRIKSILLLKHFFTYSVSRVENHQLIEKSFYKYIRHPGYLGQIVIFIGITTSLSNWLSIILMIIPIAIGYSYRIKVEERFMTEQMGELYHNYKSRTKKLIPLIY